MGMHKTFVLRNCVERKTGKIPCCDQREVFEVNTLSNFVHRVHFFFSGLEQYDWLQENDSGLTMGKMRRVFGFTMWEPGVVSRVSLGLVTWVPQMTFCHSCIHQILVLIRVWRSVATEKTCLNCGCLFAARVKEMECYKKPPQHYVEVKLAAT